MQVLLEASVISQDGRNHFQLWRRAYSRFWLMMVCRFGKHREVPCRKLRGTACESLICRPTCHPCCCTSWGSCSCSCHAFTACIPHETCRCCGEQCIESGET